VPFVELDKNKLAEIVNNYSKLKRLVYRYFLRFLRKDLNDAFGEDFTISNWVLSKDLTKIKVTIVSMNYDCVNTTMYIPVDKFIEFVKKEGV
jgi:hypothetical protein